MITQRNFVKSHISLAMEEELCEIASLRSFGHLNLHEPIADEKPGSIVDVVIQMPPAASVT